MSRVVEAILIGAGQRGAEAYGPYAFQSAPDQPRLRFIAVAEPEPARRARFALQHGIPPERQFASWEPLLALPQLADAALVCTQDWQHTGPALAALRGGYHVLLEKPMATSAEECRLLVAASEEAGRQLHICHVLRYTTHFARMRAILQSGVLGEVIDVAHRENVSFWHMAHSYVRGSWRSAAQSSPMILAKCCHDFDILLWLLERDCEQLSSAGALTHFRPENAPPGAPDRCLDGCPARDTCPYYAPWIYQDMDAFWRSFADTAGGFNRLAVRGRLRNPGAFRALARVVPAFRRVTGYDGWPLSVLAPAPSPAAIEQALREGPYGRCVYRCDNDVVDHQVALMQFAGGATVTLTMHGHAHTECRTTRIEGSWIQVDEHRSGRRERIDTSPADPVGHGGGDFALLAAFLRSVLAGGDAARTTASQALASHLLAFAAEKARLEGRVLGAEAWQ
jgi:predicted dehydrogenase